MLSASDAQAWQLSWDRQQEAYLPDREQRFVAMLDAVEATCAHDHPRVLDLAGGTGTISLRTMHRFPNATTTLIDVDPVLMTIARATLDERGTVVSADLRTPEWTNGLDPDGYDAVLTATALHWLAPDRLSGVYHEAHTLLRPGGVFINADHMPDDALPTLSDLLLARQERRQDAFARTGAATTWDAWWDLVAADGVLAALLPKRAAAFAERHPEETLPPASWHLTAMRAAGYREVGILWRGGTDAAIIGVK